MANPHIIDEGDIDARLVDAVKVYAENVWDCMHEDGATWDCPEVTDMVDHLVDEAGPEDSDIPALLVPDLTFTPEAIARLDSELVTWWRHLETGY